MVSKSDVIVCTSDFLDSGRASGKDTRSRTWPTFGSWTSDVGEDVR